MNKFIKLVKLEKIPEPFDKSVNVNNLGQIPQNYNDILSSTNFNNYKHLKDVVNTFELPVENWFYEANEISNFTGRFPELYADELKNYLERYANLNYYFGNKDYFIRTESVSLKSSYNNKIIYSNLKDIVIGIITCKKNHSPLNKYTTTITIYMIEPVDLIESLESRVFVHSKQITGICQQKFIKNNILKSENITYEYYKSLINFVNDKIISNIENLYDYTIDISCTYFDKNNLEMTEFYFIELNSFGSSYAAGSGLFHWENDFDILYGNCDYIEVRYI